MGLFNKDTKTGGFMDEIRCDESSYLIWKWHPAGINQWDNERENSIRWGSSLRVKDGEVAVFVYKQKDGTMQDFIVGPFDQIIKTNNLPILASIVGLAYEGGTPFQAEIYFINLSKIIQTKFAVPFFDIYDPRFEDFGVPVAVRGSINFKITDYREFIKLHRLNTFNLDEFQGQVRDAVARYVKSVITNVPAKNNIPLVQIETKTEIINDEVEEYIKERFKENFGVDVSGVDISTIELDKSSEGYKQLMSVTKDIAGAITKAEAEAKLKNIEANQRIEMENKEETLRIQREEGQYAMHKKTQSDNMGAFQIEKQAEVGVAGANALGKMGENGAGDINLSGGNSDGFNMAAIMASMAVGGAVGQNIAGTMNNMMSGVNQSSQNGNIPPAIPKEEYYIAKEGKATGPFDIKTLKEMAKSGEFLKESLVWKEGMTDWKLAKDVDEFQVVFSVIPPSPPQE